MRIGFHASILRLAFPAVLAVLLGCGSGNAPPSDAGSGQRTGPAPEAKTPTEPAQATAAPEDKPAAKGGPSGTLNGTIVFSGDEIPPLTMVPIQTDPQICEKHGKDGMYSLEDYVIDPKTKGIRYVIVNLKSDSIRKWPHTPKQNVVIDNRNCRFEPHVALATVGSIIDVKNSDEVYHTTHLYGPGGYQFNPGLPTKGQSEQTQLTRPGMYIIKCDRHGWMSAFLRVDDHPFHAITDEQGRFEITGIPPGTHQVEVFHEKFGERPVSPEVIEVQIQADQTATLDLKLSH
jgi:plastocyanin